ncbi:hypothetical protein D9M69_419670 [compost metagenome]
MVKARKESIRTEIVTKAGTALREHIAQINETLGGRVVMPAIAADFAGAIKGKKTVASLQEAADTELARAKIEANQAADSIRHNLRRFDELAAEHAFVANPFPVSSLLGNAEVAIAFAIPVIEVVDGVSARRASIRHLPSLGDRGGGERPEPFEFAAQLSDGVAVSEVGLGVVHVQVAPQLTLIEFHKDHRWLIEAIAANPIGPFDSGLGAAPLRYLPSQGSLCRPPDFLAPAHGTGLTQFPLRRIIPPCFEALPLPLRALCLLGVLLYRCRDLFTCICPSIPLQVLQPVAGVALLLFLAHIFILVVCLATNSVASMQSSCAIGGALRSA